MDERAVVIGACELLLAWVTEDVPETLNSDQALAIGIVVGACLKQESERQNAEQVAKSP